MSAGSVALILLAGFLAGAINSIVGSGSLITFPTLLAVGLSPVVANVSNTVGLVFGSVSGVVGYRRELAGQGRRILRLALPAAAGSALGAALLLVLPQRVFRGVVPVLIVLALILVGFQPALSRRLRHRLDGWAGRLTLLLGVFGTAVYGGYFGAAQGVIMMGILTLVLTDPIQRLNGLKNVFAAIINGVAAAYFVFAAHVDWTAAGLIALSSVAGAQAGSALGRRLHPLALRAIIIAAGGLALLKLLAAT